MIDNETGDERERERGETVGIRWLISLCLCLTAGEHSESKRVFGQRRFVPRKWSDNAAFTQQFSFIIFILFLQFIIIIIEYFQCYFVCILSIYNIFFLIFNFFFFSNIDIWYLISLHSGGILLPASAYFGWIVHVWSSWRTEQHCLYLAASSTHVKTSKYHEKLHSYSFYHQIQLWYPINTNHNSMIAKY